MREHFVRGGEHFVDRYGGPGALVSYRLAHLVGSALRGGLGVGARVDLHRWRMRRTARVLREHPTTVSLDSPATSAPGKSIVVCSLEPWDDVWRRNQFLVRELLALDPDLRFLFVEPAFDVLHERRRAAGRRHARGLRPLPEDGRIIRVEPLKLVPRRIGPLGNRLRDRQVTKAVEDLAFDDPALWINDPSYSSLAGSVSWHTLYDVTDDWTKVPGAPPTVAKDDQSLRARSETVVVCSSGLVDTYGGQRPDVVLVPNGVDVDHLREPQPRPADLPDGPTAVYVGTLHDERIDVALVLELAREIPDLAVTLVGPDNLSAESRAALAAAHNVARTRAATLRRRSRIPPARRSAHRPPSSSTSSRTASIPSSCTSVWRSGSPPSQLRWRAFVTQASRSSSRPPTPSSTRSGTCSPTHRRRHPRRRPRGRTGPRRSGPLSALARSGPARHPLRVVYYDHCARLSGGELALARLLPALTDVEPLVILGEHGPLEGVLRERDIAFEVLELDVGVANTHRDAVTPGGVGVGRMAATAQDIWRLRRRLRELRPDLLHTNSLKAALIGGIAGRLAGVPVLWHIRDRIADDYLPGPAVRLIRLLARVVPRTVIANSRTTLATLGEHLSADVISSPVVYDLVEADTVRR